MFWKEFDLESKERKKEKKRHQKLNKARILPKLLLCTPQRKEIFLSREEGDLKDDI